MTTRGFASFRNKLRSGKRKLQKAEKSIPQKAGIHGKREIKRNLIERDLVVSTELWRSVGYTMVDDSTVEIHANAPYAGYVEEGTGAKGTGQYPAPDNVPVSEIFQWMVQKPTFRGQPTWFKAFVISKSLEEKGQRSQPFFGPAFDDTVEYVKRQMRDELRSAF
jgi:HK97 gp10 family phage protein